ncbi:MAG: hypothetical protein R3C59_06885 [Planctomycetaceae bacterium]
MHEENLTPESRDPQPTPATTRNLPTTNLTYLRNSEEAAIGRNSTAMKGVAVFAAWLAIVVGMLVAGRSLNVSAQQKAPHAPAADTNSVFAQPGLQDAADRLRLEVTASFRRKDYRQVERHCAALIQLLPNDPTAHYNLACAEARLGKPDTAISSLKVAIANGFRNSEIMKKDSDLLTLQEHDEWNQLLATAAESFTPPTKKVTIKPAMIRDGVALVQESNSVWDPASRRIHTFFRADTTEKDDRSIAADDDETSQLLRKWQSEATAAGFHGVLYDNHDDDHSNLNGKSYPQLTRIEYSAAAKQFRLHNGLQYRFQFNGIVIGNSSTAIVGGPFWRSQPRWAYSTGPTAAILASQYFGNHMYLYPEHRDYDPGTNGSGGYGDTFAANTPYVIISQGSSHSDRVFMDAVAATLAAFQPETRSLLAQKQALMPSVQMIFRTSNSQVVNPADYLTGIAHPAVFQGDQINKLKMAQMAHAMQPDNVPPIAVLEVIDEEEFEPGKDYFEKAPIEKLFTTPAAISRICQSVQQSRQMTVSLRKSIDLNHRELTRHWAVLQGDPNLIRIEPQDDDNAAVKITIRHHDRRPIQPGSDMQSGRVDIGAFVFNGTYYSAPAIISFYWPENETRVYTPDGRIQSVDYKTQDRGGLYTDPALVTGRNWRDEYQYDEHGQLTGWLRFRSDEQQQQFTADGHLVLKQDQFGRPVQSAAVRYVAHQPSNNVVPLLQQETSDTTFRHTYASDEDRQGTIQSEQGASLP